MVALSNGSYRNHCPGCLWSKHVDVEPGDRASRCRALMRPDRIDTRAGKGLVVVHVCVGCGFTRCNRTADDPVQSDDLDVIIAVLRRGSGR